MNAQHAQNALKGDGTAIGQTQQRRERVQSIVNYATLTTLLAHTHTRAELVPYQLVSNVDGERYPAIGKTRLSRPLILLDVTIDFAHAAQCASKKIYNANIREFVHQYDCVFLTGKIMARIPTRRDSDVLTVAISPNDPSPSKRITSASTNESSEYIDQKFSRYTLARYINSEQSNQPFETRASIPANSPRNVHFGRERIPTSNSLNAISPYGRNANASNSASRDLDDSDIYTRKHFYLRDGHNTVGGSPAQPSRYDEGPRQRCRSEGYPSSSLNSPRVLFANDDNRKTAAQYGRAPQSSDEIPRIPSQSVQYSRRGNKDKPTYLDTDSSSYFGDDYRHSHTRFSEYRSQSPKKTSRATTLSAFDSLPNSDVICGKSVDDDDQRDFNLPALQLQRQSKNHQRLDGVTGEKKFFSCASEDVRIPTQHNTNLTPSDYTQQPHYHDQRSNSHNTGADPANNQYSSLPLSASTSPDVEPIRHPWYPNLSPHSASRLPHMPVSELFEHGTYSRPPVSDPFELSDYQSREFQSLLNTEALRHAPHPRTSGQESQELLEIQRIHSEVVKMHSQMQDMLAMRARLVSAGRADQEFTRNEILMAIRYLVSLRDGDYSESFGEDFDNTRNDTSTSDRLQPMETNHISLSNAILLEKPANGSLTENFSGLRSAPRESQGSISSTHTVQQSLSSGAFFSSFFSQLADVGFRYYERQRLHTKRRLQMQSTW